MKLIARLLILPNYKYPGAKMKRPVQVLFVAVAAFITLASVSAEKAAAAVYYMSPTGSDSNPGTTFLPWRSFTFAIPRLNPGDTLILKNGTYTASNTSINCASSARNGTASQPITIKAENERQAHLISTTGYTPLLIYNCLHWKIEGLRISNTNNPSETGWGGHIYVKNSSSIIIRRLLVHHSNAYANDHPIHISDSNTVLVEENELYHFHRHGIIVGGTTNAIVRRNYANGRGYESFSFGNGPNKKRSQETFSCYPCFDSIFENNITENNYSGVNALASPYGGSRNFRALGNIAINNTDPFGGYSYGNGEESMTIGVTYENNVAVNTELSLTAAIWTRLPRNFIFRNISIIGSTRQAVEMSGWTPACCPPFSATLENILISGAAGGFLFIDDYAPINIAVSHSNVFNSGTVLSGTINAGTRSITTTNPNLGACRVFIPAGSPMKGAGVGGADIGANVLYRYENGVLTDQPLWNPNTGEFPHGAIVAGVNDIPGDSAFDVHRRLNVNTNGCFLPTGYGGTPQVSPPSLSEVSPPTPPRNLKIVK